MRSKEVRIVVAVFLGVAFLGMSGLPACSSYEEERVGEAQLAVKKKNKPGRFRDFFNSFDADEEDGKGKKKGKGYDDDDGGGYDDDDGGSSGPDDDDDDGSCSSSGSSSSSSGGGPELLTVEFIWTMPTGYDQPSEGVVHIFGELTVPGVGYVDHWIDYSDPNDTTSPICVMSDQGNEVFTCTIQVYAGTAIVFTGYHEDLACMSVNGGGFAFDRGDWPCGGCDNQPTPCSLDFGTMVVKVEGTPVALTDIDNGDDQGLLTVNKTFTATAP